MQKLALPQFWLVDRDGQAFEPEIPSDGCGGPAMEVAKALSAIVRR